MLLLGISSTRPSFPRLTVALLLAPVATTLSEKTVAPEIAAWPFTVTWPETESSPDGAFCPGVARATIEYTLRMAAATQNAIDLRLQVLLIIISSRTS